LAISNLKAQLESLVKLQEIDTKIYGLRREKEAKPAQIKALEVSFEEKKQSLAEAEKKSLDYQKEKKDAELELGSKEENIKKLQAQLYSLKTNKEYQTMLQQIQDAKADCSVVEDKILEAMDKIDKAKAGVEEEKQKLGVEEKNFASEKKEIQDRVKEIDDQLAVFEAQKKEASSGIDPEMLARYERILSSREGLAIVYVHNNSCGGCNMFVPPQVINLIKMYDHLVTCEMCNRILYIKDN